jgi:predicted CXXCH cytochrome family protein
MSTIQLYVLILIYNLGIVSPKQDKPKAACIDCHKALIEQKEVHPVAEGCDNCHVSSGTEHPKSGVKGFNLTESMPGICFNCHEDLKNSVLATGAKVHGAINGKKSCVTCHSPHSSAQPKLLVKEEKALCFSCHNKEINSDSNKIVNIKQIFDNSKYTHGAIEAGGCSACHNPHASKNSSLLKGSFPKGVYSSGKAENFAVCFTCHDSQMMKDSVSKTATQFRNADKNLHFAHINGPKGRNCTFCHNVHASGNAHLINESIIFGKWELPIRYNEVEGGGSCFPGCHGEKKYIR